MAEWNAQQYARISGLQQAMAAEALLSLLHLKGTERVLDLGCGNGKITAEIAARVPGGSAIGVDVSADMIAFASHHFGPAVWPNIRFETGDARSLPFQEEFDVVVSFNALRWIAEQDLAQRRLVPVGKRKSTENVLEETRRSPAWACPLPEVSRPLSSP
jgi:trans-aconitate 2-methyltransferase